MINILLSGCNGKMGQVISGLAKSNDEVNIAAGYDINVTIKNEYPVFTNLENCDVKVDAIIDFSSPVVLNGLAEYAVSKKIPLVVATTGLTAEHIKVLNDASAKIPVFFSANMSLGMSLLVDLVKKAAKVLEKNFDIEIIEKHHNQKVDAPSGTALKIADAVNSVLEKKDELVYDRHSKKEKRTKNEIGIHAVRGGTIVGEHSVLFAGTDELLEINHTALSKDIFAVGALKASLFIAGKNPGMYDMENLVSSF
ncbi:MAG: 4-hydroxy-tetrahydrodipicolinate reductase [Clostridia bacterium]|jgi:4-hydroxy-tetrahydrodipicolinate reductase